MNYIPNAQPPIATQNPDHKVDQVQTSEQPVEPLAEESKSKSSTLIIVVLLGLLLVVSGLALFFFQKSQVIEEPDTRIEDQVDIQPDTDNLYDTLNVSRIDETWSLYINEEYGYSIRIPNEMMIFAGSCKLVDDSYRYEPSLVPVKIIEDNSTTYITNPYYYDLLEETKGTDGRSTFSDCSKVDNTLETVSDRLNSNVEGWEIEATTVMNDQELEQFIKNTVGSDCEIGEKSPTNQAGVYDVSIGNDQGFGSEVDCVVNYAYEMKYYPDKNVVVYWALGQAISFNNGTRDFDQEMVDSFRFVDDMSVDSFTSDNQDEVEVRQFAEAYAQAYVNADWDTLKSMLSEKEVLREFDEGMVGFHPEIVNYEIKSVEKSTTPDGYIVTIGFIDKGNQFVTNIMGDPQIIVIDEDGQWKSISWYLYQ